jgi:hypothetical protein
MEDVGSIFEDDRSKQIQKLLTEFEEKYPSQKDTIFNTSQSALAANPKMPINELKETISSALKWATL